MVTYHVKNNFLFEKVLVVWMEKFLYCRTVVCGVQIDDANGTAFKF